MSDGAQVVIGLIAVILPLMALFNRGLSLGQTAKMALAWVAIFGVVYVGLLFRGELSQIWQRAKSDVTGEPLAGVGKELSVIKSEDGHYWISGKANGEPVRFLIDSGATVSMIGRDTARRIKVDLAPSSEDVIVSTANGELRTGKGKIALLALGSVERENFSVLVSPHADDENLLGMNFLSSLSGWRVEGNKLILVP